MKLCGFDVSIEHPLFLIAGPCVIESRQMAIDTAGQFDATHSVPVSLWKLTLTQVKRYQMARMPGL